MAFLVITIAALVGFVSANSYSIGCMNTLMAIGQDPAARTCLKPAQLLPGMVGAGNGSDDDTLTAVLQNLTTSCSDEFGLSSSRVQQMISTVTAGYQTVRKVACLKDSNSGYINCVTGTLRNVETLTGTMNLNATNILSIATLDKEGLPSSVVCTNCMKGAFTLINQMMPDSFSASDVDHVTDLCGASFLDGGISPGLVPTTSDAIVQNVTTTSSSTSATSTPIVPTTPFPTPTKKNAALGRRLAMSSCTFLAISGLVVSIVGLM